MPEQKASITPRPPFLFEESVLASLKIERQQWEETTVQPSTHRMPEREHLMTTSGVSINRVYTPQDNAALDYRRDLNLPGEYPYTRGVQPTMYRTRPWTMRMFAGFGTAEDTNKRFNSNAVWGPLALDMGRKHRPCGYVLVECGKFPKIPLSLSVPPSAMPLLTSLLLETPPR